MGIKAVGFDVDGTLIEGISWLKLTRDLGCSVDYHEENFRNALEGKITTKEAKVNILTHWKEFGNPTKKQIESIVEKWSVRKEVSEVIDYLKSKGYILFIISGSFDIYVKSLAKRLGIGHLYANAHFSFYADGVIKDSGYRYNQGEVKVEQFGEFSKKLGLKTEECAFVGDGYNDIDIFKLTRGIAVHSNNEELLSVAWKKIDNLLDLKDIL